MTTEDNGFFKHRGWVSSEFKSALRRNLQRGGFRLGASSITMQMTKNVLLTKEKTLSRKVQELFLVWYLEQILPRNASWSSTSTPSSSGRASTASARRPATTSARSRRS